MKKAIFYLSTLIFVLGIQLIINRYAGHMLSVDITLISILYFGLVQGPWRAQALAFTWGLLLDAASLGVLGLHALLYAVAGFAAGTVRRQLDEDKIWTQSLFAMLTTLLFIVVYRVLERLLANGEGLWTWRTFALPVANALAAPIVFWFLNQWVDMWNYSTQKR